MGLILYIVLRPSSYLAFAFFISSSSKNKMKKQKLSLVDWETGRQILEEARVHQKILAFYSSILGGITIEPALMTVPIDDHMVHRGHAV